MRLDEEHIKKEEGFGSLKFKNFKKLVDKNPQIETADYVLGKPSKEDQEVLKVVFSKIADNVLPSALFCGIIAE